MIFILLFICFCIGFTVRAVWKSIVKASEKPSNPYIDAHKMQLRNNSDYDAYLKWCEDNVGDGMPYEKVLTDEERRMRQELGLK